MLLLIPQLVLSSAQAWWRLNECSEKGAPRLIYSKPTLRCGVGPGANRNRLADLPGGSESWSGGSSQKDHSAGSSQNGTTGSQSVQLPLRPTRASQIAATSRAVSNQPGSPMLTGGGAVGPRDAGASSTIANALLANFVIRRHRDVQSVVAHGDRKVQSGGAGTRGRRAVPARRAQGPVRGRVDERRMEVRQARPRCLKCLGPAIRTEAKSGEEYGAGGLGGEPAPHANLADGHAVGPETSGCRGPYRMHHRVPSGPGVATWPVFLRHQA
jgi:hypothetical protein